MYGRDCYSEGWKANCLLNALRLLQLKFTFPTFMKLFWNSYSKDKMSFKQNVF